MTEKTLHPTIEKIRDRPDSTSDRNKLDREWLRALVLQCGADDVGFVSVDAQAIADQKEEILSTFPKAKFLVSFVRKTNHHAIRAPQRSIANSDFHHTGREVDEVGRLVARTLMKHGVQAMNEPMAFPMEYAEFPDKKSWIIAHKPVAVAAGLGKMGIHRNVIHPKFGSFILLGSVVIDRDVTGPSESPIEYNPCISCKLCVAACPVGAIGNDGYFNFSACMTHNYREFMGGFIDWIKALTESSSIVSYKDKFGDGETVSLWQSLSYGANYKAAYCVAVCPAGEDIIGQFLQSRKDFVSTVVKPLQDKVETIYAVSGTDAVDHVKKRFPRKKLKLVGNGLGVGSVQAFLFGAKLIFQPGKASGVDAVFHFLFTGKEKVEATFVIRDQLLRVDTGLVEHPTIRITADSEAWVRFVNGKLNLFIAIISGKIRFKGKIAAMKDFVRCFPRG